MFTWILIAIAIAFIFGVIKVENLKELAKKYEPQARALFNKTKTFIETKIAEIKKNSATKSASTPASVEEKKEEVESKEAQE